MQSDCENNAPFVSVHTSQSAHRLRHTPQNNAAESTTEEIAQTDANVSQQNALERERGGGGERERERGPRPQNVG